MIARVAVTVVLLAAIGAAGWLLFFRGEDPLSYKVVVDNAFGLTDSADVKSAGVRVGKVSGLDVQRGTNRAIVTAQIEKPDFADFRKDVFCKIEPQSLIGEYFLNCQPGRDRRRLRDGATIPVEQTATSIPPDLVNNIMRRPFRERLGILFSELGAGFAGRGPDVQASIKRAIPALRETDRVLRILSDNRRTLESLTREADVVFARLAGNRDDVARFVSEARDTASASADRRADLAENIRLLPRFLRRLRPTLRDLGTVADRQTPALRDLRRAAPDLELLLNRLGPFSRASVPAVRSLGEASETGREAMRVAGATVAELRELAGLAQDPVRNLRFVLEHLDDRRFAAERNPLSPGGDGFTGLEAFLQYPFVQSQAINIFDDRGYLLKLNALPSQCSAYRNAESVRNDPALRRECSAALGPGPAPGIDDNTGDRPSGARTRSARNRGGAEPEPERDARRTTRRPEGGGAAGPSDGPREARAQGRARDGLAGGLSQAVGEQLDRIQREVQAAPAPQLPAPSRPRNPAPAAPEAGLLDYLLGS